MSHNRPDPYAEAGVNVRAGDLAVELMRRAVVSTHSCRVWGGPGGFGGLFDARFLKDYLHPILVSSTDGVGTKAAIARALDKHDTIGQDLVGMVVGDVAVLGAKPLFMTDYIACGRLDPRRIARVVQSIARACRECDCALIGGETAEHPGLMADDEYDLAGAVCGVAEADELLGPNRVRLPAALVGVASSGLHANGFSLVRQIFARSKLAYTDYWPELSATYGLALLEPTRLYVKLIAAVCGEFGPAIQAACAVTGGGIGANLGRVIPEGFCARVLRDSWTVPALFSELARLGGFSLGEVAEAWNLGVGLVLVVEGDRAESVVDFISHNFYPAWVMGQVEAGGLSQSAKGARGGQVKFLGEFLT